MKFFIDSVSGYSHLISLSNKRFEELGKDLDKSKVDEEMRVLHLFERCYFTGAFSSVCTRTAIDSDTLTNNIKTCLANLTTSLSDFRLKNIIDAAFKGITDNCAMFSQDHYCPPQPKIDPITVKITKPKRAKARSK